MAAKLNVVIRLCCILRASAALAAFDETPTITLAAGSPSTFVGMHIKINGCTGECVTNSTAIFQVKDEADEVLIDTLCSDFDAFNQDPEQSDNDQVSAHFFYAFPMTAGHTGKYWMSEGCFMDGTGIAGGDGNVYPDVGGSAWTAFQYTPMSAGKQYTNQPAVTEVTGSGFGRGQVEVAWLGVVFLRLAWLGDLVRKEPAHVHAQKRGPLV